VCLLTNRPCRRIRTGGGDAPYLSAALYGVRVGLTDKVATMSADQRWRIYANPDWVLSAEVPLLAAQLAHQAWHLLRDHADGPAA